MEQEFTGTNIEIGDLDFGVFGVFLSSEEGSEARHYLGFQRQMPPEDEEDEEPFEDDGFYIEVNGQENGGCQSAAAAPIISLIALDKTSLQIFLTSAANFHAGEVGATGNIALSHVTVHLEPVAAQISALHDALQTIIASDCPYRYTENL